MSSFYAKIENNIVIGISDLSGDVEDNNQIKIDTFDTSLLGKIYDPNTGEFTEPFKEPNPKILVSVDGFPVNRIVRAINESSNIHIKIVDTNGDVIPITETFTVPIKRVSGAIERTIRISIENGESHITINWPNSGEFLVTKDLVNMHLPIDQQFDFDGLKISVYEM